MIVRQPAAVATVKSIPSIADKVREDKHQNSFFLAFDERYTDENSGQPQQPQTSANVESGGKKSSGVCFKFRTGRAHIKWK